MLTSDERVILLDVANGTPWRNGSGESEHLRERVQRSLDQLKRKGYIDWDDTKIWLTDSGHVRMGRFSRQVLAEKCPNYQAPEPKAGTSGISPSGTSPVDASRSAYVRAWLLVLVPLLVVALVGIGAFLVTHRGGGGGLNTSKALDAYNQHNGVGDYADRVNNCTSAGLVDTAFEGRKPGYNCDVWSSGYSNVECFLKNGGGVDFFDFGYCPKQQ